MVSNETIYPTLPLEILQNIISHLDFKDRISFSCTNWYHRKVIWLDPKLVAPILCEVPHLLPFATEKVLCRQLLNDASYVEKILNKRHCNIIGAIMKSEGDKIAVNSLRLIPKFYALTGTLKDALTIARGITNQYCQIEALIHIAEFLDPQASSEIFIEAHKYALTLDYLNEIDDLIKFLARKCSKSDPQLALSFALTITDQVKKTKALLCVAKMLQDKQKNEVLDLCLKTASLIDDPAMKILMLCETAKNLEEKKAVECFENMITIVKEQLDPKIHDAVIEDIIFIIAKINPFLAIPLLESIKDIFFRITSCCIITENFAASDYKIAIKMLNEAHILASKINNPSNRSKALGSIAYAFTLWAPEIAEVVFKSAMEAIDEIESHKIRDFRLIDFCKKLPEIDPELAIKTLNLISSSSLYSDIFIDMGIAYPAKRKELFKNALKHIEESNSEDFVLGNDSKKMFPYDQELAIEIVKKMKDPYYRAKFFIVFSRIVLPISPLKSLEFDNEGIRVLNQIEKISLKILALDCFNKKIVF